MYINKKLNLLVGIMCCLVIVLGYKFSKEKIVYPVYAKVQYVSAEIPRKVVDEIEIEQTLLPISQSKRVGIQAGHWKLDEVPGELKGLKDHSGAKGGGTTEQETVLKIARETKEILEAKGVIVDLLPATIPANYSADAFVAIHADGNTSTKANGFKVAAPDSKLSAVSDELEDTMYEAYEKSTGLRRDDKNITKRMTSYYAFNWRRYDHSIDPMTPSVIVETGFMTNASDRKVIVDKPELAAEGIANGVMEFLGVKKELNYL